MKFLDKKIGTYVRIPERTKWMHEFTGLTVRQWLLFPLRVILMLPLMLLREIGYEAERALDFIEIHLS